MSELCQEVDLHFFGILTVDICPGSGLTGPVGPVRGPPPAFQRQTEQKQEKRCQAASGSKLERHRRLHLHVCHRLAELLLSDL